MAANGGAPVELPAGCATSHAFSGAGEWSLGIACGGVDYSIHCEDLGDSGWGCACRVENSDYTSKTRSYEVASSSAERAASVTAIACASDDPEFTDGPEDCQSASDQTASYCALVDDCRRSKELDGATVVFKDMGNGYSCVRQGTSTNATCDCGDTNWNFPDVDLTAGCGFARDFCRSKSKVMRRGEDCSLGLEESWETHCSVNERCDYEVELDDGSVTTVTLVDGVSCDAAMGERPACYCTDHDGRYFAFEHSETPLTGAKCWEANEVCVHMREHVRDGEFTCEESVRMAVGSSCESLSTCRQPATVGETPIDLLGSLQVRCEQGTDSSWPCTCTSRSVDGMTGHAVDLSVIADDDASACAAAADECLGEVAVVFAGGLPGTP
jgi:hypothetical protein